MRMQSWQIAVAIGLGMSGAIELPFTTLAQTAPSNIVPDGTLGAERSRVTTSGIFDFIDGGAQRGQNLFHSFSDFNVGAGRGTYFVIPNDVIRNALARVTGGNRSDILGTLGTFRPSDGSIGVPGVNLFLINSNGIVFGENASLVVGGSFFATTANAVQLGNTGLFSASQPALSNLLTVSPSAFLFNQIAAQGEIINRSRSGLRVSNGATLTLLGGNVTLDGSFTTALGGRIELGGLAASGTVGLGMNDNNLTLRFPEDTARGDVALRNGAIADVRTTTNGGNLVINAHNVDVLGGSQILAGILQGQASDNRQAGDITLNATDAITIMQSSFVENNVQPSATGNSGNLLISTGSLSVTEGSQLQVITYGKGNSGNVNINARDLILLDNGGAFTRVEKSGVGNAGDVNINTGSLGVTNAGVIGSVTVGTGNAGNIIINARDLALFTGRTPNVLASAASSAVDPGAKGAGGDVRINTGSLVVDNGAELVASTSGTGNAGNIDINARDLILFNNGKALSSVETNGVGKGGDVNIAAGSLIATNEGYLAASTAGMGNAGDVNISARDSVLFNSGYAFSSVAGGVGKGGNIQLSASSLSVINGAQLNTGTNGQGDAGNVVINVRGQILLDGTNPSTGRSSGIFTENGTPNAQFIGTGKGGDVFLTAPQLTLSNGAVIDAQTANDKPGGNITLTLSQLNLLTGSQFLTTSDGRGSAGTITLNVTDQTLISGNDPTYASRLAQFGTAIAPVSANSALYVRSSSTGSAGNIILTTPRLTLDQQGRINAESATDNGGNIVLTVPNLLLLRHNSQISTTAGTAQAGGNGGNITINGGFIIAIPKENSDITANAFSGAGGNITINSPGIFGLKFRPKLTPLSDITASSDFGNSGTIQLNAPDNAIIQNSLTEFPQTFTDTAQLLANSCIVRKGQQNGSFTMTGSGGLPQRPGDAPVSSFPTGEVRNVAADAVTDETDKRSSSPVSSIPHPLPRPWKIGDPIVEPQGVYQLANGELVMSRECSK